MAHDFPIENLPYGSIRHSPSGPPRLCVALGDDAIELGALADSLPGIPRELIDAPNLDRLLQEDAGTWERLRQALTETLSDAAPERARIPLGQAIPCLPFTVGDYSNGAVIRPGDLFASGTISGSTPGSQGCLLELTWNGERPLELGDGTKRAFLEDGDLVTITGRAGGLGFGELRGEILPDERYRLA